MRIKCQASRADAERLATVKRMLFAGRICGTDVECMQYLVRHAKFELMKKAPVC